ncbi:hypothetical protein BDN72DRAFT_897982 [Pluteus cervinus]|uniref:Uncharacterized protein n=1 Tax=Pluteus cervinus TaxID=181527 RepID=A0ACD3ASW1_9AGAR|nr:hypothetical protein BDN72DRAFT_897982 [Pluteus cervinus]
MSSPIATQTPLNNYAKQRDAIDAKILPLRAQIREFLEERNEWTPAGRLAPEILVEIFSYLQREWDGWNRKFPFLLKLTHVSRRWRAAAITCPSLWNEISFENKTLVEQWLKRSASSDLYVTVGTKRGDYAIRQVFAHLHRIRHLSVDLTSARYLPSFPDTPFAAAPVLSLFSIKCPRSDVTPSLPFLTRPFPALRELSLESCGEIDLTSATFSNFTSLNISYCSITTTLPALLALLARMPGLTRMKLNTVELTSTPLPENLPIVQLPDIQTFGYRGTNGDLDFQLLAHLIFPETSSLFLTFDTTVPRIEETSPTVTTMLVAIENLFAQIAELRDLMIKSGSRGDSFTLEVTRTPHLHIGITSPSASTIYDQYLSWMSKNTHLFTDLWQINFEGTIPSGLWPVLKKPLPHIVMVEIDSGQSGELFDIFIEDWERGSARGEVAGATRPTLILPELETVNVVTANFYNISERLIDALQYRSYHGKRLERLGLINPAGLDSNWKSSLRGVVDTLDLYEPDEDGSDSDESGLFCPRCKTTAPCGWCRILRG